MKNKKKDYRKLSEELLRLLFLVKYDPHARFPDMCMRSTYAQKLDDLLKRERRHEWTRVGAAWHLLDVTRRPRESVAFYFCDTPRRVRWRIEGRRGAEGVTTSTKRARMLIENHFEVFESAVL